MKCRERPVRTVVETTFSIVWVHVAGIDQPLTKSETEYSDKTNGIRGGTKRLQEAREPDDMGEKISWLYRTGRFM